MIKVTNDTGGVNDRDHSKRIWQMDQNEAEIASLASRVPIRPWTSHLLVRAADGCQLHRQESSYTSAHGAS